MRVKILGALPLSARPSVKCISPVAAAQQRERHTKRTRAAVEIAGCSGPGRGEQAGVDEAGQTLDAGMPDGDDERRLRSIRRIEAEIRVGVGHEQANNRDTTDVEQDDTHVHALDRLGNVAARVLRLASGDGDDLGAQVGVRSVRHDGPPAKEAALGAADVVVLRERTGVFPVAEAETVVVGASSEVEYDAKNDEPGNRQHLYGCEDELGLSICT